MRILFLTHYFPPEVNAPANRTLDHCRHWVGQGHDVHVVTCVPSHPHGIPFPGHRRAWYRREEIEGIAVHRVWTYLAPNSGVARRTLNYLSFLPTAVWRASRLGRFDVIIATSPQFFCAVAGYATALLTRTPWVFELRDLWPESIAAVGAVRTKAVLRLLERLELRMYRHASRVACVTRSFMENLERRGVDPSKLAFIPNGIDSAYWAQGRGEKARADLDISESEILVSYVGTVGMAHGIGAVLDSASRLRVTSPQTRILIVGDGAELQSIREKARAEGLHNVQFTGLVPRDAARDYLAASDICLVTLRKSPLFTTVLPSKMFEAMAAGKPIVLGVDGEARAVLEQAGAGVAVEPDSVAGIADAVASLAADADRRSRLGHAGRSFVERDFSRVTWAERLEHVLQSVVPPASHRSTARRSV